VEHPILATQAIMKIFFHTDIGFLHSFSESYTGCD